MQPWGGGDEDWSQVSLASLDPALDQSILGVRLTQIVGKKS